MNAFYGALITVTAMGTYWLPSIIAWIREVPDKGSVTVINGFLGWTFIGWIVALAMACRSSVVKVHVQN